MARECNKLSPLQISSIFDKKCVRRNQIIVKAVSRIFFCLIYFFFGFYRFVGLSLVVVVVVVVVVVAIVLVVVGRIQLVRHLIVLTSSL